MTESVTLTHLDEPLFDGAGATKRDLVDYLEAVSAFILPELRDRPLSVIRVRAGGRSCRRTCRTTRRRGSAP
jgi:DNA primase